ncbi:hypothetical protein OkiPb00223_50560 [Escherichia coli]
MYKGRDSSHVGSLLSVVKITATGNANFAGGGLYRVGVTGH